MRTAYIKIRRALAVSLAGFFALGGCVSQQGYETVRPSRGAVEYRVEDTGCAAYRDNYTIVPTVSGRVISCAFQEGDTVEEGQVLYVIRPGSPSRAPRPPPPRARRPVRI